MWRDEARAWLRSVFANSASFRIEVHRERAWGDIWRVHVDDGLHWFKAGHPALRREVRLRRRLMELAPGSVLPVVADDEATGWMVSADQGPTLATRAREEGTHHYVELAAAIGAVQRAAPQSLLDGLGVPVFDPGDAVANLDAALAWFARLPASHPCHVTVAERRRALAAVEGVVADWADIDPGIGLAIDHNDLHAGNAYPGPRISDWGDSVIGHPFCSLRPLLFIASRTFGGELAGEVRRAYLEGWGDPARLEAALDVAIRLAVPQRLLCWHALDDPDMVAEHAEYVRPLWEDVGRGVATMTQP